MDLFTRLISVDLQQMAPIPYSVQIQGDITKQTTVDKILENFDQQKADLVICDGAPDVTGFHDMDQYLHSQLLVSALNIATLILQEQGTFIAKVFTGNDIFLLLEQFKMFFTYVTIYKPKSSRFSSVESFIICLGYNPPKTFLQGSLNSFNMQANLLNTKDENQRIKNFVINGDLSGFEDFSFN